MMKRAALLRLVHKRLIDSRVLLAKRRYEGAYYLCGYAVELALKACICKTLDWPEFPETSGDFKGLLSLKTHDLSILLRLSGRERRLKRSHFGDWSIVARWSPEIRYGAAQPVRKALAESMLESAREIARVLRT